MKSQFGFAHFKRARTSSESSVTDAPRFRCNAPASTPTKTLESRCVRTASLLASTPSVTRASTGGSGDARGTPGGASRRSHVAQCPFWAFAPLTCRQWHFWQQYPPYRGLLCTNNQQFGLAHRKFSRGTPGGGACCLDAPRDRLREALDVPPLMVRGGSAELGRAIPYVALVLWDGMRGGAATDRGTTCGRPLVMPRGAAVTSSLTAATPEASLIRGVGANGGVAGDGDRQRNRSSITLSSGGVTSPSSSSHGNAVPNTSLVCNCGCAAFGGAPRVCCSCSSAARSAASRDDQPGATSSPASTPSYGSSGGTAAARGVPSGA
mmetsp:Transcript_80727/g.224707  ORF Transcript_80727/g.224707 Transcript_80727/m.224707 type:complete len:322 (+) Transcript_80727:793-1758(+)